MISLRKYSLKAYNLRTHLNETGEDTKKDKHEKVYDMGVTEEPLPTTMHRDEKIVMHVMFRVKDS